MSDDDVQTQEERFKELTKWVGSKRAKGNPRLFEPAGITPLMLAASRGYGGMVRALLASEDIDVNAKACQWVSLAGLSALGKAAEWGGDDAAEALLEDPRLHIDSKENFGLTPLAVAASSHWRGAPGIMRMLLEKGADVNSRDDEMTPLMRAAYSPYGTGAVAVLVNHRGVEVDAWDTSGQSALELVAQGDYNHHLVRLVDRYPPREPLEEHVWKHMREARKLADRTSKPKRLLLERLHAVQRCKEIGGAIPGSQTDQS
jgi:hypothetical protein